MGLGGVTIAALHAVMCLEVPFSDGLGGYGKKKEGETSVFRGQGSKNAAEGAGNRGYFGKFFFREVQVRKCLIDKMS